MRARWNRQLYRLAAREIERALPRREGDWTWKVRQRLRDESRWSLRHHQSCSALSYVSPQQFEDRNPGPRSNPQPDYCPAQGAHSTTGVIFIQSGPRGVGVNDRKAQISKLRVTRDFGTWVEASIPPVTLVDGAGSRSAPTLPRRPHRL
jgi:hypothetical protein